MTVEQLSIAINPNRSKRFKRFKRPAIRRWVYPVLLLTLITVWASYMTIAGKWHLFEQYWAMSVTMLFGSFVAGSTPQGGAAVAFPVFTKVLHIPATDSRTFGFMIQSVGMTMASVIILVRRIPIMPRVIVTVTSGSFLGTFLGTYFLVMPGVYPRILFTLGASAFGVAMIISRWVLQCPPQEKLRDWNWRTIALFFGIGIVGGIFSAQTGSGADMITFMVLTLAFGIYEKLSTPTTVVIMAINSVFGFFLHGAVSQDIGVVWDYWLVAVPVVAIGAPIGAYFTSKISRDVLIGFILLLISTELLTTILLIPFTPQIWLVTAVVVAFCVVTFWIMLSYRQKKIAVGNLGLGIGD